MSAGKLFCCVCQEEVGNHVKSSKKHQAAKVKLNDKQQRETDIAQAFHE